MVYFFDLYSNDFTPKRIIISYPRFKTSFLPIPSSFSPIGNKPLLPPILMNKTEKKLEIDYDFTKSTDTKEFHVSHPATIFFMNSMPVLVVRTCNF